MSKKEGLLRMKKTIVLSLVLILTFSLIVPTYAQGLQNEILLDDGSIIIFCDDGGYIFISAPIAIQGDEPMGILASVTGSKYAEKRDSSNNLEWKYTLYGTFSYTYGVSASCTAASYSKNIFDTSWSFSNGSATASGATATGVGTFTKKVLFITVDTISVNLTLTCDKYSNVT